MMFETSKHVSNKTEKRCCLCRKLHVKLRKSDLKTRASVLLAARWQLTKHRDTGPRENEMPTPPLLPEVKKVIT